MVERPLVSVVLPVYGGERFLADTIHSVLAQTHGAIELVVVDDGSTDGSMGIVDAFPQIRCLRQANQGVGAARNNGVSAARGDFIAFIDQDDLWLPGKIEEQMRLFEQDPTIDYALTLQRRFVDSSTSRPSWVKPEWVDVPLPAFEPSALVVRREAFLRVGPFDTAYGQASDSDWFFRATDMGLRFAVVPDVLLLRRLHGANNSRFIDQTATEMRRIALASIRRRRAGGTA